MHFTNYHRTKGRQTTWAVAALSLVSISGLALCMTASIRPRQVRLPAHAVRRDRKVDRVGALPMFFEENRGQHPSDARFLSRSSAYDVALYSDRVEIRPARRAGKTGDGAGPLVLRLAGANEQAPVRGEGPLPAKGNYFIGNDPGRWHTNISTYRKVRYADVYPGVDVVFYGRQHELEYDFVIAPGTSPGILSWRLDGARDVKLSASGELTAALPGGQRVVQHTPFSYQEIGGARLPVASRYAFRADGSIGVELASYDTRYPVVVDPVLSYSTYIGDTMEDRANAVAVDAAGNVYVIGNATFASTAPGTFGKDCDVFLWKFDPTGTSLLYYALFGGTYNESGNAIAVDAYGNAYIAGTTSSSDIPTTPNAYSMTALKTPDAFLAKIDTRQPAGSSLIFSTHFPADDARGIALDGMGKVYLTGQASWNFVTTPGAFQTTCPTCSYTKDAFAAKFDLSRSGTATLVYSTYLGGGSVPILGSADDAGYAIAVDAQGQATVVGEASSLDFPVRSAVQPNYQGGTIDGFVTRFNSTGTGLIYSTFLGTAETDSARAIALDAAGNAYVTGLTNWNGFPVTPGAFQPAWKLNQCGTVNYYAPCADAFVTKLDNAGQLAYSTYLGGTLSDYGYGIAVDSAGSAYVTGYALSYDFPTLNAIPGTGHGANDAFVVKLNPQGTGLLLSSYIGGTDHDEGLSIAVFNGDAFVAGKTDSTDFPVLNAVQGSSGGSTDGFVLKITGMSAPVAALSSITVNPPNVPAGTPSTGTITLSSHAPAGGAVVTLASSNTAAATVPASVTVAAGAASATFTATSLAVTTTASATITATYSGVAKTCTLTVNPAAALSSVTLNPASVIAGAASTGTVILTSAAPAGGAVVTLASNNTPAATVPASVTVAGGATTATFSVSTKIVAANSSATISATYSGATKTAVLNVKTLLSAVVLNPTSVMGGATSIGTVTLSGAAPAGGTVITLASNSVAAPVPASVTVAAGATSATFPIVTTTVAANTTATITATAAGASKTAALTAKAWMSSLALNPTIVAGGSASTATVTLAAAAPAGGAVITLGSSNPPVATVPATVTIAAGAASGTFTVATSTVTASTGITISASYAGSSKSALLTVAPLLSSLALNPSAVTGAGTSTGTVTLSVAAPAGGAVVTLASSNTAAATVPASVTVAAGAKTATFTIVTPAVTANTSSTISASLNAVTKSAPLAVKAWLAGLTLSPPSVVGGGTSTATLTLSAAAPAGGAVVPLTSSNTAAAAVPAAVTLAAGTTSTTFPVSTSVVTANAGVTIGASYGGSSKTAPLTVMPLLKALVLAPSSITGAGTSTATVTLNGAAPAGGSVVALASSNSAAAGVPASVTVAAGATSVAFMVTTTNVAANTSAIISASLAGVTKTSAITVKAWIASVTMNPASVAGGGTSIGTVTLGGPAPAGGATVGLSSANTSAATVPASIVIPAGATAGTFTAITKTVAASTGVSISAAYAGSTKSATLSVF